MRVSPTNVVSSRSDVIGPGSDFELGLQAPQEAACWVLGESWPAYSQYCSLLGAGWINLITMGEP